MTLTGSTTLRQSEPGSNGNEGILHILQSSRTGVSPLDGLVSYPGHSLPLCKDAVSGLYSPNQLS